MSINIVLQSTSYWKHPFDMFEQVKAGSDSYTVVKSKRNIYSYSFKNKMVKT